MNVARYVVDAVGTGGAQLSGGGPGARGVQELGRKTGGPLPTKWLRGARAKLQGRAPDPQSELRWSRTPIIRLRKELTDQGFDAGAQTIHYHLGLSDPSPPSVATIWRVLMPPAPTSLPIPLRLGFFCVESSTKKTSSSISLLSSLPYPECFSRKRQATA